MSSVTPYEQVLQVQKQKNEDKQKQREQREKQFQTEFKELVNTFIKNLETKTNFCKKIRNKIIQSGNVNMRLYLINVTTYYGTYYITTKKYNRNLSFLSYMLYGRFINDVLNFYRNVEKYDPNLGLSFDFDHKFNKHSLLYGFVICFKSSEGVYLYVDRC